MRSDRMQQLPGVMWCKELFYFANLNYGTVVESLISHKRQKMVTTGRSETEREKKNKNKKKFLVWSRGQARSDTMREWEQEYNCIT